MQGWDVDIKQMSPPVSRPKLKNKGKGASFGPICSCRQRTEVPKTNSNVLMLVLDFDLDFKCGCKAGYGYNTKQSMIGAYPGPGVNRHTPVNDQHKQLKLFSG